MFLPPEFPPIRGRQAVEAMYRSFFPTISSIEQEAVSEEVEVMGTGPSPGAWNIVPASPGDSTPIRMDGKGLSILKRRQNHRGSARGPSTIAKNNYNAPSANGYQLWICYVVIEIRNVLVPAERPRPSVRTDDVLIKVAAAGAEFLVRISCSDAGTYPPPPGASDVPARQSRRRHRGGRIGAAWRSGDQVCALVTGGRR